MDNSVYFPFERRERFHGPIEFRWLANVLGFLNDAGLVLTLLRTFRRVLDRGRK
jgi:hypothetical protein